LSFELMKARSSSTPIVVIDDPISSFDSIYKNKVIYAIVKMLKDKKKIILTHNTDLIRLLDGQFKNCFNLYLMNNTDGEENGFIRLNNNETKMLINLEELLKTFREEICKHVKDGKVFLVAMIPFMRGYSNIVGNKDITEKLTQVMHGYKTESVNLVDAYSKLFGKQVKGIPSEYKVCVLDILKMNIDGIEIIDNKKYPLLNRTLRHSFQYLKLRLMVEKALVEKYSIDTSKHQQLGQIISAAFPDENDIYQMKSRVRLTSKKTLLNEFNHFEGNLSIFQPAIDITDTMLKKEVNDIENFVHKLQ